MIAEAATVVPAFLIASVGGAGAAVWAGWHRQAAGDLFRVVPAPGEGSPETLFRVLHGLLPPLWRRIVYTTPTISCELVGTGHRAYFRIFIPRAQFGSVERFLRAAYPGLQLVPEDPQALTSLPFQTGAAVRLINRSFLPLLIEAKVESLAPLLAVLGEPNQDEAIEVQLLARPISRAWQGAAFSYAERLRRGGGRSILDLILGWSSERPASHLEVVRAGQVEDKAAGLPFSCAMRVLIRAQSVGRARELLRDTAASLRPFTGSNSLDFGHLIAPSFFYRRFLRRELPLTDRFVLTTAELAALWHMPAEPPMHLIASRSLTLPPPFEAPRIGRVLGIATHSRETRLVAQSLADARMHTQITGPTGVGKSTLLLNLILQDLWEGRGLALLDPKADLVQAVLARLPRHRLRDIVLISPLDQDRAVGVNPLYCPPGIEPVWLAESALAAFRRVYEHWWGPRTDEVLRSALLTLIRYPGATLAHIPYLLTDASFRQEVVALVDDPLGVASFWRWYERLSEAQRAEVCSPLLNRLRAFLSLPRVRRLLCQPKSTIDLGQVMNRGGVLLVDLAAGVWGETTARLVGSLVFAQLWHQAQRRAALPESARRDFHVYVDEFSQFMNLAGSFSETLAQARSLRLPLTLAHQHLGQLTEEMQQALASNARSRVVFQCGSADARIFAREFGPLDAGSLMNLPRYEAAVRLAIDSETSQPFTIRTLPPPDIIDQTVAGEAARLSAERFGRPVAEVDAELLQALNVVPPPAGPLGVGRRARR